MNGRDELVIEKIKKPKRRTIKQFKEDKERESILGRADTSLIENLL
jgi:hypothetical protein